ncbi:MAG TPA: hypothetical protein VF062_27570 [Candidatus Limnocylindrales bacterium]
MHEILASMDVGRIIPAVVAALAAVAQVLASASTRDGRLWLAVLVLSAMFLAWSAMPKPEKKYG